MAASLGPKIITNGLLLALDAADRNSYPGSGTLWTDLSGKGNNGALVNGPTFNGSNGGGIVFDGVDDGVNASSAGIGTSSGSVCVWVKSTTPSDIYNIHSAAANQNTLWAGLYAGVDKLTFRLGNGTNSRDVEIASNLIFDGGFHFVCTTWTVGVQMEIWLDGVKLASAAEAYQYVPSATFEIGYKSWGPASYNGSIYNLISYNRALTATEISQNFNAERIRFGI